MERKAVFKWLKVFSIIFLVLSIVELLDLILFSSLITITLDSSQISIISIIFQSGFMTIHAMLLWIILLCVICSFMVLSFSIFKLANNKAIESERLAKHLLIIGLFLIIGGFIKTTFFVLLGNSTINTGISDKTLQYWLYLPSNIIGNIMWIYFTVVVSCFLISGLIFGGIGLKWMLLIQEGKSTS
ncbi:MAG: hypothetical protein ACFE8G_06850 [Candidatus Hermodarchaeota archaeon]